MVVPALQSKLFLRLPVPVSCEENEVAGSYFFPLQSCNFLWNSWHVSPLNSWGCANFLARFKKNFFQWLISSLFQEKNHKYFLAEKQVLKEWSSISISIIKAVCLSSYPFKVSLSDAYSIEKYKSPNFEIHPVVVTIKVLPPPQMLAAVWIFPIKWSCYEI